MSPTVIERKKKEKRALSSSQCERGEGLDLAG